MNLIGLPANATSSRTESARWSEPARERRPRIEEERREAAASSLRRPALLAAVKDAVAAWVAEAKPATVSATGDTASTPPPSAGAVAGETPEELDEAIADFAAALLHALRGDRGRHLGHAYGRPEWSRAAERLALREASPAPAAIAPTAPGDATAPPPVTAAPAPVATVVARPAESPWKRAHDGLIDAFSELQAAIGRPARDDQTLEEQLREMLAALKAKLRTDAVTAARLAPPGSLLSVVA